MSNFGRIIENLKKHPCYAYREGWNGILAGKDMRLTLETVTLDEDGAEAGPVFILSTDTVPVVGWLASQTDMLAEDWVIKNVK